MVTRILIDPRRDLPDGTTQSNPVTITATPTGINENGQVVLLPSSLSFSINTAADVFQLPSTTASWKWRLAVRDTVTDALLQTRTVLVPDQPSIQYAALPDVDPASLGDTPGHARNWDATFAQILDLMAGIVAGELNDAAVASLVSTPASATATALAASLSATYSPLLGYSLTDNQDGTSVIAPGGSGLLVDQGDGTSSLVPVLPAVTDNGDGTTNVDTAFARIVAGALTSVDTIADRNAAISASRTTVTDNGDGTTTIVA